MVLQNGKTTALWGWSAPGASIKTDFLDGQGKVLASVKSNATAEGRWMLKLLSLASGTSGILRFTAGSIIKTVQDVVVNKMPPAQAAAKGADKIAALLKG